MKVKIYLTVLLSVLVLLVLNATVYAANTDSRIEATARQSYVFRIY